MDPVASAIRFVRQRSGAGRSLPDGSRVSLHFHPYSLFDGSCTLSAILSDRRYRSQFLTGTSNGGLTAHRGGDRWTWESCIFGGAYDDHEPDHRPVYGALDDSAEAGSYGPAPRFGSAHFRFRPNLLPRTTFAFPDSTFEPTAFGVSDRMQLLDLARNAPTPDPLDHYVEAHIHGGVAVPDDVEALVLDPSFQDDAVHDLAIRSGLTVEWHQGYRVPVAMIEAHPEYRGTDVVTLARQVADKGTGHLTPASLMKRPVGVPTQNVKKVWHYIARYGRQSPR